MRGLASEYGRLQGLEIAEEPGLSLSEYGSVSIAFEMNQVLVPASAGQGLGGMVLSPVASRQWKDYDAIPGNSPADWPAQFDITQWGWIAARLKGRLVGCAAVVHDSPDVSMLAGRSDLALLWDLRVAPEFRGHGIGSALWRRAEAWAARRACRQLGVETQNTNAGACGFYARQGCYLGAMNVGAYPDFPDEIQLLWFKDLPEAA